MIEIFVPIKLQSPNVKEHWRKVHARNKRIAVAIGYCLKTNRDVDRINQMIGSQGTTQAECEKAATGFKLRIQLFRQYKGKPFDFDNYVYSMKPVRDSLCSFFFPMLQPGQADGLKLFDFTYLQVKDEPGILIRMELVDKKKEGNPPQTSECSPSL